MRQPSASKKQATTPLGMRSSALVRFGVGGGGGSVLLGLTQCLVHHGHMGR